MAADEPPIEPLSPRELDVLALAAEGRTNDEIAEALSLSVRTVERHLSNIYLKLGLTGPAAAPRRSREFLRGGSIRPARVGRHRGGPSPRDGASARFRDAVAAGTVAPTPSPAAAPRRSDR